MLVLTRLIPFMLRCALGLHFWEVQWWFYDPRGNLEIRLRCMRCGQNAVARLPVGGIPILHTPRVSFLRGPLDKEIPKIS